ncbi:T9SS type A sorting domain-containing protein [bacterium SCSIO 12741]|nr:T9SS type A sorting domain-containing protein [bacterium SCSIO 12741]
MNSEGNPEWITDLDGDYGHMHLDCDSSNRLYSIQDFEGTIYPNGSAIVQTPGTSNMVLLGFDTKGKVNLAQTYTSGRVVPSTMVIEKEKIFVGGEFYDTLNLSDQVQLKQRRFHLIYSDGFVACLDLKGNPIWSYVFDLTIRIKQIVVDQKTGDCYVLGLHFIDDWKVLGKTIPYRGKADCFVAKFQEGNLVWLKGFGSIEDDDFVAMTLYHGEVLVELFALDNVMVDGQVVDLNSGIYIVQMIFGKDDGKLVSAGKSGRLGGLISNGSEDFFYNGFRRIVQNPTIDTSFVFYRTIGLPSDNQLVLEIPTYLRSQGIEDEDMKGNDLIYGLSSFGDSLRIGDSIIHKPDFITNLLFRFTDQTLTGKEEMDNPVIGLKVYPNPTSNYLNIELPEVNLRNSMLTILDNQGRELKSWESRLQVERISVHDLKAGTYYVRFESNTTVRLQRFVVTQ